MNRCGKTLQIQIKARNNRHCAQTNHCFGESLDLPKQSYYPHYFKDNDQNNPQTTQDSST